MGFAKGKRMVFAGKNEERKMQHLPQEKSFSQNTFFVFKFGTNLSE